MSRASRAPGLLGVLGGMGPLATIDFLQKLLAATPAETDQEHVPVVTASVPQIPDRAAAFRGGGASPLPAMIECGQRLIDAGVSLIVMPCNTAHLWYEPLQEALAIPMIHLVDAALDDVAASVGSNGRVGLLATDATIASGLYLNRQSKAGRSLQWLLPTGSDMADLVMPGIHAVKSGHRSLGERLLSKAAAALAGRGAQAVLLGCTEIPVVLNNRNSPVPVVDATDSLARRSVAWSVDARADRRTAA
ncbi:amino acid racemase [Variovorax sp. J22P271]|uniref:aspartate/glutamate racemase family protein n=1 Tax=Variovorax davisae TaxID=3053515 RepID=UPI002578D603|nr:amino acid racemase [Variovorax sp. J22P271]MDM0035857.1 amino acid racemase [Variovorax sp. J22P271]